MDPRPDEVTLVLEALVTTASDGADEQLEPWRLPDRRLLAELVEAQAQATRARARWLALLAEAERREATLQACGLPTANWLTNQNTHWARSAREELRLAVRLAEAPVVGEALGRGEVSVEQAQVIVTGLARLPIELDAGQREQVAGHLVELAAEFGPYGLSRLANRAVEVVAPEVAEDADRRAVERIAAEQNRDRYLTWQRDPDGAWLLRGKLGKVAGQQLVGLLRALAARQRSAVLLGGDDIARTQAAADALVTLAEHYSSCRKSPRHGTDTGEAISAAEARRLACDADILPMVLNGDSVPLDVGRKRRLFDSTLRQVLIARDQGCAFPGCDRDPADCEAHHRRPWWAGGVTSLANGVLLCSFHHHLVEPDPNAPPGSGWQLRLDVRGRPEFLPPGAERWRQHHRYRT